MGINDIKRLAVERIYLVPDASEGQLSYLWCDDPAPSQGMDPAEAVEYVRKDVHEAIVKRQASAAKAGMDAAKRHGSHMESEAKRLHAECNPEALESERETNAKLTELVAELERERDMHKAAEEVQIALRQKLEEREAALAAHVERLQEAGDKLREPWDLSTILGAETRRRVERWDKARADSPSTSLARRDLIKQAEGWEQAAHVIEIMECPKGAQFFREGVVNHLRYKAEKMRRQAEVQQ